MRAIISYPNWDEAINSANVLLKLYDLPGRCTQEPNLRYRYEYNGGARMYRSPYQLLRDVKREVRKKARDVKNS